MIKWYGKNLTCKKEQNFEGLQIDILKEICPYRRLSNCEILQNFRCQTHKQHEKRGRREETNSATLWRGPRIFNSAHRNVCCSCICYLFFMHTVVFYYCVAEISLPETRHLCHFV